MNRFYQFILAFVLLLLVLVSPAHAQENQTSDDLKPNDSINVTPSVCMMYHFGTRPDDPLWPGPNNNLAVAADGTIYGAASNGGCASCHGVVFKMTPNGQFSNVHVFNEVDGDGPSGGLAKGPGDVFYGTTYSGGKVEVDSTAGHSIKYTKTGTIFSVTAGSTGITPIWSFRNNWLRKVYKGDPRHSEKELYDAPASYPVSPPVTNKSGQTMGVTTYAWNQHYGALYSLEEGYTTVENMGGGKSMKLISLSPGVTDNNFYGVSVYYGPRGKTGVYGTVFMTSGGPLKVLHIFDGADGAGPKNVIQGKDGKLYGTTYWGGMYKRRHGVIYSMNSDGTDYKILHQFNRAQGSQPFSALVWGTDNRLYGTTRFGGTGKGGVLFRINPDGSNFTVLYNFKMPLTGNVPQGNMVLHPNGYFYGTTSQGGLHYSGGIFRLDAGLSKPREVIGVVSRVCCSLGQYDTYAPLPYMRLPYRTGGPIDPLEVLGHHSGRGYDSVGYVYTRKAGLIDIGHVRWMADTVKRTYDILMLTPRNELPVIYLGDGEATIKKLPLDQEEMLRVAGAITYVQGWAHELITWNLMVHNWSSFSPEDLVSNVVGIMVAQRAIRNHCGLDFDTAMDIEMFEMMKELQARPKHITRDVLDSVEQSNIHIGSDGKWFTMVLGYEFLVRRNFDVWPWLVPWEYPSRPAWLNNVQYKKWYPYFDFAINKPVDGKSGVTLDTMQAATDAIRKKWVTENPGMDTWPRPAPKKSAPPAIPGWPDVAK